MVNPASYTIAAQALDHPQEIGDGISAAATGIGNGVSTAATGVGSGVGNAAVGIGSGVRESKIGDAAVETARGEALAKASTAQGEADAKRITALATLAEKLKGLPKDVAALLLEKAPINVPPPKPEAHSVLIPNPMAILMGGVPLAVASKVAPKPAISEMAHGGKCTEAPQPQITRP